jgi:hypothetical protein
MRHKVGNKVLFGDVVQLLHVKSKKYLTIKDKVLARDERENTAVFLSPAGNSFSWMQLMPRYKIDKEGDRISNNSELIIHVSEKGQDHLHCAERDPAGGRRREINSSMEAVTPWRVSIFESTQTKTPASLMCGELVYIKDPEFNSYLSLFVHPVDPDKDMKGALLHNLEDSESVGNGSHDGTHDGTYDSMSTSSRRQKAQAHELASDEGSDSGMESVSSAQEFNEYYGEIILKPQDETFDTNCLWVLESKLITAGGPIRWRKDQYHLRHLNTGKYLSSSTHHDDYVVDSSNFVLSDRPYDKTCLFNFFELHSQNDYLQNNKAIQLRQGGMFVERDEYNDRWGVYVIKGNRNRLRATNLIISRYTEEPRTSTEK